ncbi:precorrin-6y C5,15-methyltransferase (decarboxylating) subunit CbiE [Synechococcus sp. HB1133]|uniref:precorrin-6y C5,15-methyltransferase (decarboxylating) subunit CbiE n=1 Tax=unclassified Synechococcus TaxID=2626047 RepID=UPI00140AD522|nr:MULTISPECIES: precorrin-6y C5,15-methyltransferase (decarboxylating) subunit CbiE [unclassified Synechococcus]MCB4393690.1 precorrin-6y C5,15-methyltransferase (decarboxylating) subunit CbiE [Synechococcus sp. PH41509]MCB4422131.1 precorrin-6y C5,15-methyltransferase (decarboxylating) subunit CbiE [Synechococcus sp. HB1133]MCB4429922.1 precorrin-6y C5,15-methyltransferase (decarboxylating) subunit CbiE [Synechococcus sp. HBA1120]NHI81074.1 precorrin-6y C5,15-methyltransferase (decarboxylatin
MIDVIGTDAGAPASLPAPQQKLLRAAALIAAPQRLQAAVREWLGDDLQELISSDDPRALVSSLQSRPAAQPMVVLASGDPLWFGLGRILCDRIGAERLQFHPAPTSLQLAFARIGRPWQDADWVSLHGRDPEILASALQKRPAALAVLTDPNQGGASTVQRMLRSSGLEASTDLWLCENLGHADEQVQLITPGTALPEDLHPLLIALLIAREPAVPDLHELPLFGLDDGLYLQHSDHPGLMTKREVRVQLLAELALPEHGVLWDLGAGTGSVGLEALRLRPRLQLLAVERRAGGAQLIQRNAQRLGVSPSAVLEADAIQVMNGALPAELSHPDRVLLGGGGAQRERLLQQVLERLRSGGVVVIPLASLEALASVRPLLENAGLEVRVQQLQAWRGQPLGDGTRLAPMNPTLIVTGTKRS